MFKFVSAAIYFGEIVEWFGFAIATWSYAGLVFAVCTAFNLVPRAVQHHEWYKNEFKDEYPRERNAVFPLLF